LANLENGHAAEEKTDIVEGKKSGSLDIRYNIKFACFQGNFNVLISQFSSKLNVNDFLNVDCLLNDEEALDLTDDKVIASEIIYVYVSNANVY
jgi:hypothetical protein